MIRESWSRDGYDYWEAVNFNPISLLAEHGLEGVFAFWRDDDHEVYDLLVCPLVFMAVATLRIEVFRRRSDAPKDRAGELVDEYEDDDTAIVGYELNHGFQCVHDVESFAGYVQEGSDPYKDENATAFLDPVRYPYDKQYRPEPAHG